MKRFLAIFKRDVLVGSKNYFFIVIMILPILMALLVSFVVPEEIDVKTKALVAFDEQAKNQLPHLDQLLDETILYNSQDEIREAMKEDVNTYGIVFTKENGKVAAEIIFQGYESTQQRTLILESLKAMLNVENMMASENVKTIELGNYTKTRVPFNLQLIPIFIVMEPALLGLFVIATLVFSEKEERTVLAYGVSPGTIIEFLLSKLLFMFLLGVFSVFIIMGLTIGINEAFLKVVLILIFASVFGSSLGLLIASFFKSLSKAMIWLVFTSAVMTFPLVTFMMPTFAPTWIKVIPTYTMLHSINEAIFSTGNSSIISSSIITLAVIGLITFILSVVSYQKTLLKD